MSETTTPERFISVEASSILYIWNWLFMDKHIHDCAVDLEWVFNTTVCALEVLHFTQNSANYINWL